MHLHAVLIAALALAPQPADGSPVDLKTYVSELNRASGAIRQAATLEDERAVAARLPGSWIVNIDGQTIHVDAGWIRAELGRASDTSWVSIREQVARRLDALRLEASEPRPQDRQDARAALTTTLARKEFQRDASSIWIEHQRERIARWILRFLNRVFGGSMGNRAAAELFAWVASVLALAALSFWLVSTLTRRARGTSLNLDTSTVKPAAAREWALRALAAARNGDLREALRCGYLATLRRLEEQGAWSVDESRTPREYARLLPETNPHHPLLRELTHRFEQVWYGGRTPTSDDTRQLAADLERLGCLRPGERTI